MGAILRNTVFHSTIKTTYGVKNDIIEDQTNDTIKSSVYERNQNILKHLDVLIYPLHNFPIYFVGCYTICIVIYVLLSSIYYYVFHPWKIIISEKKANEHLQEVELECLPQQDMQEIQLECIPQQHMPDVQLKCIPQPPIQEAQLECIPQQLIQEVQLECIPQKYDDETSSYAEISHL